MAVVMRLSISATAANIGEELTHWLLMRFLMERQAAEIYQRCVANEIRFFQERHQ